MVHLFVNGYNVASPTATKDNWMVNMFVCSTKTNAIRTNTANNTNAELGEISPEVSGRSFVLLICLFQTSVFSLIVLNPVLCVLT